MHPIDLAECILVFVLSSSIHSRIESYRDVTGCIPQSVLLIWVIRIACWESVAVYGPAQVREVLLAHALAML